MRSAYRAITNFCIFTLITVLMAHQAAAQETGATYLERELSYLMSIWPGDYDNQEQISLDQKALPDSSAAQGRFHAVFSASELPALGENVLYMEKSLDGALEKIYEQRLYVLSADESQQAIRVRRYAFKKPKQFVGAGWDTSKLAKLNIKQLIALKGCDILLRRDHNDFVGSNADGRCENDDLSFRKHTVRVSKDQYSFNDRRINSKGETLISDASKTPRILERARWFACMVDVPKDVAGRSNFTQHYIKIHDQGGRFRFTHPDGREMMLLMRNTWSYGMQRSTFFIGVFEGDANGKLLVYSWGMPGSDRIGMNPGHVRIQCDLDSRRNVELQKGLRAES